MVGGLQHWELSVSSVNLRAAITQQPERQVTSGLVCVKAPLSGFHVHQSACEMSLGSLSYSRSTLRGTVFPIAHELESVTTPKGPSMSMSDGDIVLDFLTNLCGLSLSAALPKVKGFLAAGVRTRAALFALTEGELKDKCGITHAAQRKKVRAAHVRAVPGGVLVLPAGAPSTQACILCLHADTATSADIHTRRFTRGGSPACGRMHVMIWLGAQVLAAIRKGEAACVSPKKAKRSSSGGKAFADADGGKGPDPETPPQELPLCEIDTEAEVSVNRSPVMILWAAVIAHEVVLRAFAPTRTHARTHMHREREREKEGGTATDSCASGRLLHLSRAASFFCRLCP